MKRLLAIFVLLCSALPAYGAFFDRDDCDEIPSAQRVTNGTMCLQRTDADGRFAGQTYIWNGADWEAGTSVSEITGGLTFTGEARPAQITSNQNNYTGCDVANNTVCFISTDALRSITGIAGASAGQYLVLFAIDNGFILENNDAGSTEANQFAFSADISVGANQGIILHYDGTATNWRAASGISGGGGQSADDDLTALAALASTGIAVRTGTSTWAQRTIVAATAGNLTVTNGDGVSGNPTLELGSTVVQTDTATTFGAVAVDMSAVTALTAPKAAGATPTAAGVLAYDTTSHTLEYGENGTNRTVLNTTVAAATYLPLAGGATTGALTVGNKLRFDDVSPSQITSDQNNYIIGNKTVHRVSSDASRNITGIDATDAADWIVYFINVGAQNIVFVNQSGSSTAANRMVTDTGSDITLAGNQIALAWYDATTTRWRVTKGSGGSLTAEADTLATVMARGKIDTTLSSYATRVQFGDATGAGCGFYVHAVSGPRTVCWPASGVENDLDHVEPLVSGKKKEVQNSSGTAILTLTESTGALTNVTLNANSTGNVITLPEKRWFPFAACNATTPSLIWDSPAANAAAAACSGTSVKGVADFDAATDESLHIWFRFPSDFNAAMAVDGAIVWFAAATSGTARLGIRIDCSADGESHDVTSTNTSTAAGTPHGTTNRQVTTLLAGLTVTGCAAGELAKIQVYRDADGTAGTDDMAGDLRGIGLELTYWRTM